LKLLRKNKPGVAGMVVRRRSVREPAEEKAGWCTEKESLW